MPTFRCMRCGRRVESPVVIGTGDCPHCGGDVVFDLHAAPSAPPEAEPAAPRRWGRLRRLLGR